MRDRQNYGRKPSKSVYPILRFTFSFKVSTTSNRFTDVNRFMIYVGTELLHACLWCPVLVCQHCSWAENGDIVIRHTVRDCKTSAVMARATAVRCTVLLWQKLHNNEWQWLVSLDDTSTFISFLYETKSKFCFGLKIKNNAKERKGDHFIRFLPN